MDMYGSVLYSRYHATYRSSTYIDEWNLLVHAHGCGCSMTVVRVEAANNNEAERVTYLVAIRGRCHCNPHSQHPHTDPYSIVYGVHSSHTHLAGSLGPNCGCVCWADWVADKSLEVSPPLPTPHLGTRNFDAMLCPSAVLCLSCYVRAALTVHSK